MISRIRGICVEKSPVSCLIDVSGVGYELAITLQCYNNLPDIGKEAIIYTFLSVSENAMNLYGFHSTKEKEMFLLLISVSGIGPKSGQVILSGIPHEELQTAIVNGDILRIKSISGIGKKTAERIIVELKDKLEKLGVSQVHVGQETFNTVIKNGSEEAVLALISLGYKRNQVILAVQKLLKEDPGLNTEEIIKKSLRLL